MLESPNYPQKYLPNYNCMWMIQAPLGNKLNISFVHFDLEEGARPFAPDPKDCRYDYLEVRAWLLCNIRASVWMITKVQGYEFFTQRSVQEVCFLYFSPLSTHNKLVLFSFS